MNYRAALKRLGALKRFGIRPGLERIERALAVFGSPQHRLKVIQIAGTNGKGSTAAFADALCTAAGLRVARYTSPHLVRYRERMVIAGAEISEAEMAEKCHRLLDACPEITLFEASTAIAFAAFADAHVDVAVIEAGLGGRLDSTNVFAAPLVSVITGVALDHTEILGPTKAAIAVEKAGIFKANCPAVVACDDAAAMQVLQQCAEKLAAPFYRFGDEIELWRDAAGYHYRGPDGELQFTELGLRGAHQLSNAALALAATGQALATLGISLSDAARRTALQTATWPGRLELLHGFLLDGAHNPDAAQRLAQALPEIAQGRPMTLIFGAMQDKDAAAMLAILAPLMSRLILTRAPSPRACDPAELQQHVAVAEAHALDAALLIGRGISEAGGLVVVAGSLLLVGEVRQQLTGEATDPVPLSDASVTPLPQKL